MTQKAPLSAYASLWSAEGAWGIVELFGDEDATRIPRHEWARNRAKRSGNANGR
jgi:hypothetical protein